MHASASKHASSCSITAGSDDEVECITTSADSPSTSWASAEMVTPQGASVAPATSPKSRPAFAGSLSMAPTISIACFSRIRRAMDAPIGPTPYCMARIFFFTSLSVSPLDVFPARGTRYARRTCRTTPPFPCSEPSTIKEPGNSSNAKGAPPETNLPRCIAELRRTTHNGPAPVPGKTSQENAMLAKKLSEAEIKESMNLAKGWSLVDGKLHRELECEEFV